MGPKSEIMSVGNILYVTTTNPMFILPLFHGPVKPHFGHLYSLPNFLHFAQRFICISPQFGQSNFVDSAPGGIGLRQLVHVAKDSVAALSAIMIPR